MVTTFTSILDNLKSINSNDWMELETIKFKAIELLKRKFPLDYENDAKTIRELKPKPELTPIPTRWTLPDMQYWYSTIALFKSIIEAKMETYNLEHPDYVIANDKNVEFKLAFFEADNQKLKYEKTRLNDDITNLQREILKLKNTNEADVNNLTNAVSESKVKYDALQSEYERKTQETISLRTKFKLYNATFWTIIVGVPSFLFFLGFYLGNSHFDSEKLSMRDTIITLHTKVQILSDSIVKLNHKVLIPRNTR